jgi:hypothetical protein
MTPQSLSVTFLSRHLPSLAENFVVETLGKLGRQNEAREAILKHHLTDFRRKHDYPHVRLLHEPEHAASYDFLH